MHTHRASATGWRGKKEIWPQRSSVFISAPPMGLNCAWSCARINQNLGECRSTAKHQGDTNWGRDTSAWDFSRKQESIRHALLMSRWGRMRWHLLILGSHQLTVSVLTHGGEGQTASCPPWPLRDFKLPLKVFRNFDLCHRESCAGPSSPGWQTAP